MHSHRSLLHLAWPLLLLAALPAQEPLFARLDASTGPGALSYPVMIHQPHNGRTLLFGGFDAGTSQFHNETWEFSPDSGWARRTPATSPSARDRALACYDGRRHVVVMFGGWNGSNLGDTWEWNGEEWLQVLSAANPPARGAGALAYYPEYQAPGYCVLYGGDAFSQTPPDTWLYDGAQWTLYTGAPPNAIPYGQYQQFGYEQGSGLVFRTWNPATSSEEQSSWWAGQWHVMGPYNAQIYRSWDFGYAGGPYPYEFAYFALNPTRLVRSFAGGNITVPIQPSNFYPPLPFQSTWDSNRMQVVVKGAQAETRVIELPDLINPATGRIFGNPTRPAGRSYPAMGDMDAFTLMFGGRDALGVLGDTWMFDGSRWVQRTPINHPSPRLGASIVYMPNVQQSLLYGGYANANYSGTLSDWWGWNGSTWSAYGTFGQHPGPRAMHAMVFDRARNVVLLFGGYNGTTALADTWQYDPVAVRWTQLAPSTSPPARNNHTMVYDRVRNRTLLFGGADQNGIFLGDTWEYDGTTWSQRTLAHNPPARWSHVMTYDRSRNLTVLTGGYGDPQCGNYCARLLDDVWEFNGADWRQRTPSCERPVAREGAGMAFDPVHGQLMLFGGHAGGGALPDDTWTLFDRTDVPGPGMITGTRRPLRVTNSSVAAGSQPFRVEFDNPTGIGIMMVSLATLQLPTTSAVSDPALCGQINIYRSAAVNIFVGGSPTTYSLAMPAWMKGLGLTFQGAVLETSGCFAVTDPLVVVTN